MHAVVLATRNKGKIREFSQLLKDFELEVVSLDAFPEIGDIPETGATFAENAMIKARAVAEATGLVAVADDSGLEVEALSGAPGVYSARYSDPGANAHRNNDKLLKEMAQVPDGKRAARFACAMVAYAPSGAFIESFGAWPGQIAHERHGEEGFGYDPLFFDPELGMTAAQMAAEVKNARSHRGRALAALLEQWPAFWAQATQTA